jgi:hypothetical protein
MKRAKKGRICEEYAYGNKTEERERGNRCKSEGKEPRHDSKRKTEEEWKI